VKQALEKHGMKAEGHGDPVEERAPALLKLIDNASREGEGGQFVKYDGTRMPW
jgi:hypothetical protein